MRVLCVCLGNICRSPMAEGVVRAKVAGLDVTVDSAGTGAWHVGDPPDRRAIHCAAARGYDLAHLRARRVERTDFGGFDRILAMDHQNLADLHRLRPVGAPAQIALFHPDGLGIPDPYHLGAEDFDHALDLIEEAADALVMHLKA